jgi:4-alpha-glucanotransferase
VYGLKILTKTQKARLEKYIGTNLNQENICSQMIRLAYISPSCFAVIPMQDILSLDEDARINTPGKTEGNWEWKLVDLPDENISFELYELSKIYGRT